MTSYSNNYNSTNFTNNKNILSYISYLQKKKSENNKNTKVEKLINIKDNIVKFKHKHSDSQIIEIQDKFLGSLSNKSNNERLQMLQSLNVIKVFNEEHNYSERVELLENYVVKKVISYNKLGYHLYQNEVGSLLKLVGQKHMPQLIAFNVKKLEIYMTYCGPIINVRNIPDNWKQQLKEINEVFKRKNIHSNDMILRNVTVLNGIINIIDFGLNNQFSIDLNEEIRKLYYSLSNLYNSKLRLGISK